MDDEQLIARQARRIAEQDDELRDLRERLRNIHLICVCIPGPLNGNRLKYTREQMEDFFKIDSFAREEG